MDFGLNTIVSAEGLSATKQICVLPCNIAGRMHSVKFNIDFDIVKSFGWPTEAFEAFNNFIKNSDAALKTAFEKDKVSFGDYLNPERCKVDKMPDPTYNNFKNMVKFTTVVFGRAYNKSKHDHTGPFYCALCGEMPWDNEHGVGAIIYPNGKIFKLTSYMNAYEHHI